MRRYWRCTCRGDCNACAESNAGRVMCCECQRRVAIRPDHLAIRRPAVIVAKRFKFLEYLPVANIGCDHAAEFHRDLSLEASETAEFTGALFFERRNRFGMVWPRACDGNVGTNQIERCVHVRPKALIDRAFDQADR